MKKSFVLNYFPHAVFRSIDLPDSVSVPKKSFRLSIRPKFLYAIEKNQ